MDTHTALDRPLAGIRVVDLMAMGSQIDPKRECQRIEAILQPATREECLLSLKSLRLHFAVTEPANKDDARIVTEGYLEAMRGAPRWAVIETCRAFVQGTVEGPSTEFMPKAATVGRELTRRLDDWRMKLGRAQKQAGEQEALGKETYGPLSPEARAKGEKRIAELKAGAEEDRRRHFGRVRPEWTDPNPITAEMLADIPDAEPRGTARQVGKVKLPFDDMRKIA